MATTRLKYFTVLVFSLSLNVRIPSPYRISMATNMYPVLFLLKIFAYKLKNFWNIDNLEFIQN